MIPCSVSEMCEEIKSFFIGVLILFFLQLITDFF